jgi:hypothetical protein
MDNNVLVTRGVCTGCGAKDAHTIMWCPVAPVCKTCGRKIDKAGQGHMETCAVLKDKVAGSQ